MTIAQAKKLQAALKKVQGTCTLLVVPAAIKEYPWASKEYNAASGPYVIAGQLEPDRFYVPEKNDEGGWAGVFSVVVEGNEIPVQWVASYIAGTAFTLVDSSNTPVAIFATYDEANKKYVERWPPTVLHQTGSGIDWPKILDPRGYPMRATYRGPGVNYPWTA